MRAYFVKKSSIIIFITASWAGLAVGGPEKNKTSANPLNISLKQKLIQYGLTTKESTPDEGDKTTSKVTDFYADSLPPTEVIIEARRVVLHFFPGLPMFMGSAAGVGFQLGYKIMPKLEVGL